MGIKYPGIDKFPIAVTNEEIESMKSYKYEDEKTLTENRKEYEKSSILSHKCTRKKYKSCHNVPIECLDCSIDNNPNAANCIYGELMKTNCTIKNRTECVVRNLIF